MSEPSTTTRDVRVPEGTTSQATTLSTGPAAQPQGQQWLLPLLALLVTFGFLSVLILLMFRDLTATMNTVVGMMLGTLQTGFGMVLGFYFGSSLSSARKTELLQAKNGEALHTGSTTAP